MFFTGLTELTESTSRTASRSVQSFCRVHGRHKQLTDRCTGLAGESTAAAAAAPTKRFHNVLNCRKGLHHRGDFSCGKIYCHTTDTDTGALHSFISPRNVIAKTE